MFYVSTIRRNYTWKIMKIIAGKTYRLWPHARLLLIIVPFLFLISEVVQFFRRSSTFLSPCCYFVIFRLHGAINEGLYFLNIFVFPWGGIQKMDGEICLTVYIVTAINYKLIYSRHLLRKNSQIFPLICTFVCRYSVLPA